MKIVVASSQFPPTKSGYARTAHQLWSRFREQGHEVELVSEPHGCSRMGKVALLTEKGKEALRRHPDVVQVIGPAPLFSEQVVNYALREGVRVVYMASAFAGLATYYDNPVAKTVDAVYEKTVYRSTLSKAHHIVFNTQDHAHASGVPPEKASVIPCGYEDTVCTPNQPQLRTDASPKVLYVGQLRPYKGWRTLLQAVTEVKADGYDAEFEMIGNGPDETRIRQEAQALGLGPRFTLTTRCDDHRLHEGYRSAEVLTLPSVRGESFGIVLVEAAAHGVKTVATALPGVREVASTLGGRTVEPGNPRELAQAIEESLDNHTRPRREALSRFSWASIASQYLQLYKTLP